MKWAPKSRVAVVVTLAFVAFVSVGLFAQTSRTTDVAFKAAQHIEEVESDLRGAIDAYAKLAQGSDRAIAATALVRMAACYEKLGEPEAQEIYQRVLHDYADQAEPVAAARARLAALEVESTPASTALHSELLWPEPRGATPLGGVSPDGNLVTYVDWVDLGNLAVRNLATGESRRLTHTADNGITSYANESRISPSGEQVVYTWWTGGETGELRLLPLHGDRVEPRTVWSPASGWAGVQDWFPSGDRVVAVVTNGFRSGSHSIVTVSTVDGRVRQVRSIEWGADPQVRVSPDGRFLAYSRSASREAPEKDIFLVAVDGSSETVVVQHAADDELVAWSRNGSHLLFNSDRSGQPGLWAQRVRDAAPAGEPRLLIANLDVGVGMGVTRDGSLHYPVRVTRRRLKMAELDIRTGRLLREPANVTDRFVGSNNQGVFSPDGETLAYTSNRRGWTQRAIVIRSLKTGEERDLPHTLQHFDRLSWRLDSNRLMVRGQDDGGRFGYFDVNGATGQTRPLTPDIQNGSISPDGTQILYRDYSKNPDVLYSYRVADGSVHAIPGVFPGRPSLSPDGRVMATIGGQRDRSGNLGTEIRLHSASGGDGDVLWTTDDSAYFGRWTTWTPDGAALLVLKQAPLAGEYMWRLWVVPVDGSEPVGTDLVYEPANAGAVPLGIHPDGTRIVYAEGRYFHQFWAVHNLGLD